MAGGDCSGDGSAEERFATAFDRLEIVVVGACRAESEWPAQIAAGIYAGIDFLIANPGVCRPLGVDPSSNFAFTSRYQQVVKRLADLIRTRAPVDTRLSPRTYEALVGGIVAFVQDHLRFGRIERLERLRPELVLLALLPYLSFEEAQRWSTWPEQS